MNWRVHDLLRLRCPGDLHAEGPVPAWVNDALLRAPWAVVRRAPAESGFVPVGVRGHHRGERFACFLDSSSIIDFVTPEALSSAQAWQQVVRGNDLPAMRVLPVVHTILRTADFRWGPVGSVGFQLASGVPAALRTSDLDLIVRLNDFQIPLAITEKLLEAVQRTEGRVDMLLETAEGAISFVEYLGNQPELVLRGINGPRLILRREFLGENTENRSQNSEFAERGVSKQS
jgi:phosphoribosyl-dephospho-CoA transferase